LPEERSRHDELERLLKVRLVTDPARAVRKAAEFRAGVEPGWSGLGIPPLVVRWFDPPTPEAARASDS
jgi:hypothetical protein